MSIGCRRELGRTLGMAAIFDPDDVFDRAGIEEILVRHWDRHEDHTHLVTQLATHSTAFRLLASGSPLVPPEAAPPA